MHTHGPKCYKENSKEKGRHDLVCGKLDIEEMYITKIHMLKEKLETANKTNAILLETNRELIKGVLELKKKLAAALKVN